MTSFIGCILNLMATSGLESVLISAFGGVEKILSTKNFPQNLCDLLMAMEELIRVYIGCIYTADKLETFLKEIFLGSKIAKVWMG